MTYNLGDLKNISLLYQSQIPEKQPTLFLVSILNDAIFCEHKILGSSDQWFNQ